MFYKTILALVISLFVSSLAQADVRFVTLRRYTTLWKKPTADGVWNVAERMLNINAGTGNGFVVKVSAPFIPLNSSKAFRAVYFLTAAHVKYGIEDIGTEVRDANRRLYEAGHYLALFYPTFSFTFSDSNSGSDYYRVITQPDDGSSRYGNSAKEMGVEWLGVCFRNDQTARLSQTPIRAIIRYGCDSALGRVVVPADAQIFAYPVALVSSNSLVADVGDGNHFSQTLADVFDGRFLQTKGPYILMPGHSGSPLVQGNSVVGLLSKSDGAGLGFGFFYDIASVLQELSASTLIVSDFEKLKNSPEISGGHDSHTGFVAQ